MDNQNDRSTGDRRLDYIISTFRYLKSWQRDLLYGYAVQMVFRNMINIYISKFYTTIKRKYHHHKKTEEK